MAGMEAARRYERELSRALISGLQTISGLRIWGITDPARLDERVPTVSFTLEGHSPDAVAEALGREGIYVWNGNFYAPEVTTTLGLEASGGMVRIGAVHYNTQAEIERLIDVLCRLMEQRE
jgi:selenocysteine lyase/cysteine desulfurase